MDLRRLRTFVAVAEHGTVSKASLQLNVAQPALSRQISDLEAELQVTLFDRVRRRLVLTEEGEWLLGDCRNIVAAADALPERAQLLRRPNSGVLKVAATPQTIDGVFSGFLHRYTARFPNVRIKLLEAVGTEPYAKLERGELHFVISFLQVLHSDRHEFASFPLPPLDFLAVGPRSLRLGSAGDIEIKTLTSHPLLLLDTSFGVRTTFDAACRLAGVTPHVFLESRAPHTLLSMAEAGHGVAVVPSVLPTHRYRLAIARITYRRRPLQGLLTVLWNRRRVLPPSADDFCEFLAAYMREVLPISRLTIRRSGKNRAEARERSRSTASPVRTARQRA